MAGPGFPKSLLAMPRWSRGQRGMRYSGELKLFRRFLRWRLKSRVTDRLGPFFSQQHRVVQIDITYDCNLKCHCCDRGCSQAPTEERVTVEQVARFLEQSRQQNRRYDGLRVMGGEPTMHPDLMEILGLILDYKKFSPGTVVRIESNGFGKKVNEVLKAIPEGVMIRNTDKKSAKQERFKLINVAPVDMEECEPYDYSNACRVKHYCGVTFTPFGFYLCGAAAGIDRIFGFDMGCKELPAPDDELSKQTRKLCRYCGFFWDQLDLKFNSSDTISKTWTDALEQFKESRPVLTPF